MRTTTRCVPWYLLLACVWPLQAQQTTVKGMAGADGQSTGRKEPGTRVSTVGVERELSRRSLFTFIVFEGTSSHGFCRVPFAIEARVLRLPAGFDAYVEVRLG